MPASKLFPAAVSVSVGNPGIAPPQGAVHRGDEGSVEDAAVGVEVPSEPAAVSAEWLVRLGVRCRYCVGKDW